MEGLSGFGFQAAFGEEAVIFDIGPVGGGIARLVEREGGAAAEQPWLHRVACECEGDVPALSVRDA